MEENSYKRVDCPYHPDGERTLQVDLVTGEYVCVKCGAQGHLQPQGDESLLMEAHWLNFI